ncbi:MAG: carbon storage regulator [Planctomycetales bacterium]|nr:carbon storage regulator [Planctomycetales bacterium]
MTHFLWHGDCIRPRTTSGSPYDRQPPATNGMVEQTTKGNEAMLILTRKRDDSIKIGEDIVVRVMRTARGSVKIGIEAPASVRIVRGELNEFGDIAGASDLTCAADLADLHDDDSDDEHLHDELALAMHSAYDLEMVMQH